ncbi:MAG: hypothetical protein ACYTBZ_30050 [Planctomycetota bacterium]|jgi:hypothetical protein
MGATYQMYLTDDKGVRLAYFGNYTFMNYARILNGVDYIALAHSPLENLSAFLEHAPISSQIGGWKYGVLLPWALILD